MHHILEIFNYMYYNIRQNFPWVLPPPPPPVLMCFHTKTNVSEKKNK
jgi:hypothetical protein